MDNSMVALIKLSKSDLISQYEWFDNGHSLRLWIYDFCWEDFKGLFKEIVPLDDGGLTGHIMYNSVVIELDEDIIVDYEPEIQALFS